MAMTSFYEPNWPDKLRNKGPVQATAQYQYDAVSIPNVSAHTTHIW